MRRVWSRFRSTAGLGAFCPAFALSLALEAAPGTGWAAAPVRIVAAENVYGQVAAEIAGAHAEVTSILTNPAQDPHDFEARPSTARAVAAAAIVEVNGAGYDPWMERLLAGSKAPGRDTITVATLMQRAPGANPHLWYDPAAMPRFAEALTAALYRHDPAGAADYAAHLKAFLAGMARMRGHIAVLRARFGGAAITATEPVFSDMARALGLTMRNERLQVAVMNGTEPRASDVAAMDADLCQHMVRALLINAQVTDSATQRLVGIAQQASVPVVRITETLPPGKTYVDWMDGQLNALASALAAP